MRSSITSKFQTTIPKGVREHLGLSINDALEWKLEDGKITIYPAQNFFLKYKNAIKTGKGDIKADIEAARSLRMEKYR